MPTPDLIASVLALIAALCLGVVSPGPSFILVARTAAAGSRRDGLAAALGMGVGGVLFAFAALLGLHGLLAAVPVLYVVLKAAGGAYLIYLGYRIWRSARLPLVFDPVPDTATGSSAALISAQPPRAFRVGLLTQVSNPKTAVVYASVFAALLPRSVPNAMFVVLPLLVFIVEAGWYALVALVLSAPAPRGAYLRFKASIDRAAGGVMALLGLKLLASARTI